MGALDPLFFRGRARKLNAHLLILVGPGGHEAFLTGLPLFYVCVWHGRKGRHARHAMGSGSSLASGAPHASDASDATWWL